MTESPRGETDQGQPVVRPIDGAESSAAASSLGEAALSGSLWTILQVTVVKVTSIVGMLALTHLLAPEVFGVATLALSVQALLVVLHPFTLGDVLLSRSRELTRLSGTALRIGLMATLTSAIAIALSGPWAARHYATPALVGACLWVSLRPLAELTLVLPITRLRSALQFRRISMVDAIGIAAAMLTSVILAWAGLGYISLIVPPIAFVVVRAGFLRRASPTPSSPDWVPEAARGLWVGYLQSGLGQYVHGGLISLTPLIVGTFTSGREVGWYSMAFTMSTQINAVVGFGMGLVLQPIFAQMAHDPARQTAAFLRACRVLATIAMPVCLLQAALAPAAFRIFLPESWEGAILLTQILSLGQAFFFCINPSIGLLTAQGRFGTFVIWQSIQLVVVGLGMLAAGLVWRTSPLVPIVLVGGLYHAVSAPIGVWISVRNRVSFGRSLGLFLRPFVLAAVSILPAAWILSRTLTDTAVRDPIALVLLPLVSLSLFGFLVRRFDSAVAEDLIQTSRGIARRWRPGS